VLPIREAEAESPGLDSRSLFNPLLLGQSGIGMLNGAFVSVAESKKKYLFEVDPALANFTVQFEGTTYTDVNFLDSGGDDGGVAELMNMNVGMVDVPQLSCPDFSFSMYSFLSRTVPS